MIINKISWIDSNVSISVIYVFQWMMKMRPLWTSSSFSKRWWWWGKDRSLQYCSDVQKMPTQSSAATLVMSWEYSWSFNPFFCYPVHCREDNSKPISGGLTLRHCTTLTDQIQSLKRTQKSKPLTRSLWLEIYFLQRILCSTFYYYPVVFAYKKKMLKAWRYKTWKNKRCDDEYKLDFINWSAEAVMLA